MKDFKWKTAIWSAIGGAVVVMIIGFTWGGWVTGGTSEKEADNAAQQAVIDRLVPICVEQFNNDPEKDKWLKELKGEDSWSRDVYVEERGWATMPFEKEPDSDVADKCAEEILKLSE